MIGNFAMQENELAKKQRKNVSLMSLGDTPTAERILRGNVVLRNGTCVHEDPLRIDRLLSNGIIDEMQHLYGMQIITLWTIASRPHLKVMQYEMRSGGGRAPNFEHINLSRISAEDQFYKTMRRLATRDHGLIRKICFEEMPALTAGRELGLPVNSVTIYVRAAFDALGNALAEMRREKKQIEKAGDDATAG